MGPIHKHNFKLKFWSTTYILLENDTLRATARIIFR